LRHVVEVGGDVVDRRDALRDSDEIAEIEDEAERDDDRDEVGQHQLSPPPRHDQADQPEHRPRRRREEQVAQRGQPGAEAPQTGRAADRRHESGRDRADPQHHRRPGDQPSPVRFESAMSPSLVRACCAAGAFRARAGASI
jgi:hypothetical protein